ncbi:helix-turn-helix domain-containing protein [Streptomyces griseus]|uniref:helix-turn-helix domain-containing protein n=1 Tax=Streptomyces griseus TaxID=1911 RepID=UPI00055B3A46|nr:helix-turn-helix domain-containing protein [Streptomyces griseus]
MPDSAPRRDTRGIVAPAELLSRVRFRRHLPAPELRPYLEHYWLLDWALPEPYVSRVVPHPSVNLVFQRYGPLDGSSPARSGAEVSGVGLGLFTKRLEGVGRVCGAQFRPGGFRPFAPAHPVSDWTGRRVPLPEVFPDTTADTTAGPTAGRTTGSTAASPSGPTAAPTSASPSEATAAPTSASPSGPTAAPTSGSTSWPPSGALAGSLAGRMAGSAGEPLGDTGAGSRAVDEAVLSAVLSPDDDHARVAALDAFLLARGPAPDPAAAQARELVELVRTDRTVRRVARLSRLSGLSARSLQRLFAAHVGVGPKWVILRYRLHEALERAEAGTAPEWADLAAELGYSDQAHLVRDFTSTLGLSPTAYARELSVP